MARNSRWFEIRGSFRSGILSAAAQEQVDDAVYREGAANLENFRVLRDGGLAGRPGLVRGSVTADDLVGPVVPSPRYGLLAGREWRTGYADARVDDFAGQRPDLTQAGRTFPAALYDSPGGIALLERVFSIEAGETVDTARNVIEIDLAPGVPRALTLHGCQLVQGHWRTDNAMTFAAYYVQRSDGVEVPCIATPSNNPFARGQFAPGILPRDIVLPLVQAQPGQPLPPPQDVSSFRLRVAAAGASLPLTLAIQGVSCFSTDPPGGGALPADAMNERITLSQDVFGDPYRILPWQVGGEVFVLVLGMEWVAYYARPAGGLPVFREGGTDVWSFTERQLRELTWTAYGTSVLLFHHDFPWPLEVVFPENPQSNLQVRYLPLQNIPRAPEDAVEQARRTTYVGQTLLAGTRPSGLRAETRGTTLLTRWLSTGAPRYRVRWAQASEAPATWPNNLFVSTPSYSIPNITPGANYVVSVSSIPQADVPVRPADPIDRDATGESLAVESVFQARFAAPADPSNLMLANSTVTDGVLDLAWDAVPDADGYDVDWRNEGNPLWTRLASPTTNRASTVAGIGTVWEFRVRAFRGTGNARNDSQWSATVSRESRYLIPAVPGGLAGARKADVDGGIAITWNAAARARGYELQWATGGGAFGSANQASYTGRSVNTDFEVGPVTRLRVRAVRGATATTPGANAQRSGWSAPIQVVPRWRTPAAPASATLVAREAPTDPSDGLMRVTWPAAALAQTYEVQTQRPGRAWSQSNNRGLAQRSWDENFTPGNRIRMRVRSVRGGGSQRPEYSPWTTSALVACRNRPSTVTPALEVVGHETVAGTLLLLVDPGVELELGSRYRIRRREVTATGLGPATFIEDLARVIYPPNSGPAHMRASGWSTPAGLYKPALSRAAQPHLDIYGDIVRTTGDQSRWQYEVSVVRPNANPGPYSAPQTGRLMPAMTSVTLRAVAPGSRIGSAFILFFDHAVPAGITAVDKQLIYRPTRQIGSVVITFLGAFDSGNPGRSIAPGPIPPPPPRTQGTAQRGEVAPGPVLEPTPLDSLTVSSPIFVGFPLPETYEVYFMIRTRHADGSTGPWSFVVDRFPAG